LAARRVRCVTKHYLVWNAPGMGAWSKENVTPCCVRQH
jgi:hypothetical protein